MDNATKKLQQEQDRLLAKAILEPLTQQEEKRLDELKAYFDTLNDVDEILTEAESRDVDREKDQCYSVYDY